jgi:hypothetical protein
VVKPFWRVVGFLVLLCSSSGSIFFERYNIDVDIYICTDIHPYEHMHAHPIPMNTSKRLNRLDIEIHKVDH